MKKLEESFERKGMVYKQRYSCCGWFIYQVNKKGVKKASYYEVFRKRIAKESVFMGKVIEEHEMYPTDNAFGDWAWCCNYLDDCFNIMNIKRCDKDE